ncbi:hypothetical protein [Acinetobacter sp. NIPH 2100]|uniref:hypothetical protein n=1 Tax=Acinetobacter sp. NIPH 2100 TaxID=1217708 RepID=UPI0002CDB41D|nr:hypothetical protein [Acinetobacter sp. NIPH 2100]ENX39234.1 hypothetical protein F887_03116 [Acinetobacter sp. NIPH 2100]
MKRYYLMTLSAVLMLGGCTNLASTSEKQAVASSDHEIGAAADAVIADAAGEDNGQQYGGIKKQYVVKGCQVTIYNDGPIQMVDEKTDQPCNAPIPKDHQFSKVSKTYTQNGCKVTEFSSADGTGDAIMDCSKKK